MRIFLSYRRSDVGGYAGRLADGLRGGVGADNVFQDVLTIAPGEDYTAVIDRALDDSDVLLAVIGPGWLTATAPDGSARLAQADDYVRLEVVRALDRGVRVVPVLVGGARLPAAGELPEDLRRLAQRQAVVLRDESWHQDVDGLLRSLRGEAAAPTGRRRRRGPVLLAVAVLLVVLGAGAWWLARPAGGGGGDPAAATETATEEDSEEDIASCTPPAGDGWSTLPLSADPTGEEQVDGGRLDFAVAAAHWRADRAAWQVVLETSMTADVPEGAYHGSWRYDSLVVGQRAFPPTCFSPTPDFVDPDTVGDALVGFDVTCEPAGYVELRLEDDADRIDVTPPDLGPGDC
ncbi:TIR domain-containing protein [Geodermatophilus telluris]|uniref:TIR domain-containing protein n=1 Tax=Geodermatophilus telluris TaxID=1190417 RepID=A0A1G6QGF1_9ACTN|nr:toll/interleukin-1 receptor domain-containing protein [Geodermatophilus telluris]SDC90757.1 TIR domain-containing protein [Geodermatophilus telluris]